MRQRPAEPPPPGIAARFAFECPRCGGYFDRGSRVVFQRGEYICVGCAPGADDE